MSSAVRRNLTTAGVAVLVLASAGCGGSSTASAPHTHHPSAAPSSTSATMSPPPSEKVPVNKGAVTKALGVGKRVDLGAIDGFRHLYLSLDAKPTAATCNQPDSEKPAAGERLVQAELTMQGIRGSKTAQSPLLIGDWVARDAHGHATVADWSVTMRCVTQQSMFPTTLNSADVANGTLVFEVPKNTRTLTEQFTYAKPPSNFVIQVP